MKKRSQILFRHRKIKFFRIGGAKYKVTTAAAKKREVRYMKPIKRAKSDPDPGIDQGQGYYVQGNFLQHRGLLKEIKSNKCDYRRFDGANRKEGFITAGRSLKKSSYAQKTEEKKE